MKRTQSRPNLNSKESSSLKKPDSVMESAMKRSTRGTKQGDDVGELLMRHNSYSLITDTRRDRFRPTMIKIDTAAEALQSNANTGSSRLMHYNAKPDSNYGKFKKTVVKKRSSNMLFSQLGFAAENKPSNRIDSILNNRKPSESGSINLKNNGAHLMGRLSPHSQASLGENFRFDFLDHSISGHQPTTQGGGMGQKKSKGIMPYLGSHVQDRSFKPAFGSKSKQTVEELDNSESSTSLSQLESNVTSLTSKMHATAGRLSQFLTTCKKDQQEKLTV